MKPNYHDHVRSDVFAHITAGGRLIDVGGGVGATAAAAKARGLADSAGVVDAVNADAAGLDFAVSGDLTDPLLLSDIAKRYGPFDTVLALDVVEHLADPWALVAAMHQMLAPGGSIVASIPNVRHYHALFPLLFRGRWDYVDAGILDRTHLRFFVRDTAIALMTSSGLRLEGVAALGGRRLTDALDRLTFGLTRSFTARAYMVKVTRAR